MSIKDQYTTAIIPELKKELKFKNNHSAPQIKHIVVNVGIGSYMQRFKDYSEIVDNIANITGQKPIIVKSKVAISNFKLRKDMPVGIKVTLRQKKMYEFLFKLINIVFPRVRDFRGFSKKLLDGRGNLNIGLKDYTIFPEISQEDIVKPHGLQISIVTTANNNDEAIALFQKLNFPFKK